MMANFLLITNASEAAWLSAFAETLARLGVVQVAIEEDAIEEFLRAPYELVIIDAATVKEPVSLARKLHDLKPDARVAVMTTIPTWREARDILRAGAVDYFPRTLSSQELLVTIRTILREEINNEPDDVSISR
jgi:DNA-binding response OmpR family regulator